MDKKGLLRRAAPHKDGDLRFRLIPGTLAGLSALLLLSVSVLASIAGCSREKEEAPPVAVTGNESLVRSLGDTWTGDLDEILKQRRAVRVLVYYSKTSFAVVKGQPQGLEYELLHRYEDFLARKRSRGKTGLLVVFIPVPHSQIIPLLLAGKGDVAAGLTITPQRERQVAFTTPYISDVREVVVTTKGVQNLHNIDDLSGKTVYVVAGSSYAEHLRALNSRLRGKGRKPVNIVEADKVLEAGDILEMVNSGILSMTVVDQHIAELWACVLPDIVVRKDVVVASGSDIAWAVRKDNPGLLASLDGFIRAKAARGSLLDNMLFSRYYGNTKWIRNPVSGPDRQKLIRYESYIRKYAKMYHFDWLMIAAMAYQESRLDPHTRSHTGARGILQVRPSSAAEVGIHNISGVANNIHAGVKYLGYLRNTYFNDPAISPADRVDFALAAYDTGADKVQSLRQEAAGMGLDPNKWFFNVEIVALREIGRETVQYVADIYKYYIAYKLSEKIVREKQAVMRGHRRGAP